jgi:hypothetical protein
MGYDRLDCYSMLIIYIYTCINDQHSENCLSKNLWYTLQIAILIGKLWWTIKIWPYLQTNPRTLYFHGRCSLKSAQCTRISYNTAIHGSEWDLALHLWRGPHKFGSVGNEPYKNPGIHRILYPQLYLDHRPHLYITGIHFQLPTDGLLVVCCVSVRNGLSQWYNNLKICWDGKSQGGMQLPWCSWLAQACFSFHFTWEISQHDLALTVDSTQTSTNDVAYVCWYVLKSWYRYCMWYIW